MGVGVGEGVEIYIFEFEKPAILVAGSSCAFLPTALHDEAMQLGVEGRWKGRAPTAPAS